MRQTKLNFEKFDRGGLQGLAGLAMALLLIVCFPDNSMAQQKGQKTFSSAEEASRALFAAAQANDEKKLLELLGSSGKQVISSGDASDDESNRANFVQKYQEMHRLVKEPDGNTTLYIGAENWPTPIPLVDKAGAWYFDTDAGKDEILLRRIGHNEISAIRVCQELVAAEKEYYAAEHNVYAQKFMSDEGQQNGLYWPAKANQPESPVGPLIANASTTDTAAKSSAPEPFHGYLFRVLTRQGKGASGGSTDYVVNGKMTKGFAFVAYPAEYRNSGVTTFIVNQDGVVYEKDLGAKTVDLAKSLKEYAPDSSWQKAEEQPEQPANEQKAK
jgi:hypothetical protein